MKKDGDKREKDGDSMENSNARIGRNYSLDAKIEALNQIDALDGNIKSVSRSMNIAYATVKDWRADEAILRRQYQERLQRQRNQHYLELQITMLKRGKQVLDLMRGDKLNNAPLNQLATALGSLISHALKMTDVIEEIHDEKEQVIRHEYFYDDQVQDAPPWADRGDGQPRAFQRGRLREALGEDHAGQNGASGCGQLGKGARLVAGADDADGEPGLARPENERQAS